VLSFFILKMKIHINLILLLLTLGSGGVSALPPCWQWAKVLAKKAALQNGDIPLLIAVEKAT
jgi:hypothetical protein